MTNSAGTILDESDFYPLGGERVVVTPSSCNSYEEAAGIGVPGDTNYGSHLGMILVSVAMIRENWLEIMKELFRYRPAFMRKG